MIVLVGSISNFHHRVVNLVVLNAPNAMMTSLMVVKVVVNQQILIILLSAKAHVVVISILMERIVLIVLRIRYGIELVCLVL